MSRFFLWRATNYRTYNYLTRNNTREKINTRVIPPSQIKFLSRYCTYFQTKKKKPTKNHKVLWGASVVFSLVNSHWLKWKFPCKRTGGKQREDLSFRLQKCWSCTFFSKNVMCNTFIYISNQETIFILEDIGFHYCEQKCGIHPQLWSGHRGKVVSGHSELAFPSGVVWGVTTWRQHSNSSA